MSSGYGLVQPRVGMSLEGARRSRFASMYSGITGIDPYAGAVSDTYQDVFGEGSFTGKGIFEVDLFRALLDDRFPDNTLLSHDLIEGAFLRVALASDVEVLDDYPANYLAAASRMHRWIRGDWQIMPYLGPTIVRQDGSVERNPLNAVSRWKIFDNLRRALVPPATLLLFTVGWMLLPQASYSWPLVLLLVVLFPAYFSLADSMIFRPRAVSFGSYAPDVLRDFYGDTERGLLSLSVLPYHAWMNTDASVRAVWRRFVSHKHLLEWETAADAEKRAGSTAASLLARDGRARARVGAAHRRRVARRARALARRTAACRAVACRSDVGVASVAAHSQARACRAVRRRPDCSAPSRPQDVAVLRHLRGRRGPPPGARQLPGGPRRGGRVAHLPHQHGAAAALGAGCARLGLHHPRGPGGARLGHA